MKCKMTLAAMAFAMTTFHAAAARQPEIKLFGVPSGDFLLIEPRLGPPASTAVADSAQGGLASELKHEAASFAVKATQTRALSIPESVNIPLWMRSSSRMSAASFVPRAQAWVFAPDCDTASYNPHPALNASQEMRRQRYFPQMAAAACGAGVPVELFDALIIQESRYNPNALSSRGASGLTQLMPATAKSLGVFDHWSVSQNLAGGARYLRKQLETFGNWAHALGAYNAGPSNVTKYGGVPPFTETRGYVRTILSSIDRYQRSRRVNGNRAVLAGRGVMLVSFKR